MNVLAIDQGTSATKALLVGPDGEVLGRGEVLVATRSVGADGVEADPEELYGSVVAAGDQALAAAGAPAHAVALANQGETVLAWDRATGTPPPTSRPRRGRAAWSATRWRRRSRSPRRAGPAARCRW